MQAVDEPDGDNHTSHNSADFEFVGEQSQMNFEELEDDFEDEENDNNDEEQRMWVSCLRLAA